MRMNCIRLYTLFLYCWHYDSYCYWAQGGVLLHRSTAVNAHLSWRIVRGKQHFGSKETMDFFFSSQWKEDLVWINLNYMLRLYSLWLNANGSLAERLFHRQSYCIIAVMDGMLCWYWSDLYNILIKILVSPLMERPGLPVLVLTQSPLFPTWHVLW